MTVVGFNNKAILNKVRVISICLCIVIAILAAYLPTLENGYIWDDDYHVTENPLLKNIDGLKKIWFERGAQRQYYPLTLTNWWIEYQLWGLAPFGYHLVNIILHALNTILLFYILRLMCVPGAWMIATIFALHPVHVESVAWISERKNLLSGFFYLSSLFFYCRFALHDNIYKNGHVRPSNKLYRYFNRFYLLSIGLFLCALLSKTITCSLPAAVLLLLWWKKDHLRWHDVVPLIPMFLMGVVLGLNTVYMEKSYVGAKGLEWTFSFFDRCLIAGRALWFYVGKLIWPYKLTFIYPRWEINSTLWWQYLFPLATIIVIVALWILRKRFGKGPLVAVLFFSGTLLPALGFFHLYPQRYSFVADHFQYLASIGIITLVISSLTIFFNKYSLKFKIVGLLFFLSFSAFSALQTWKLGHAYKNEETLYEDILTKNPKCWLAHNNLGVLFYRKGRMDEAIKHYLQALLIPDPNFGETHFNMGLALLKQGYTDEAIKHFAEAIRINPDYPQAHYQSGLALVKQRHTEEATKHFEKAIRINPDYYAAHYQLGLALAKQGHIKEAVKHFEEAIRINSGHYPSYLNLGIACFREGNTDRAINSFKKAIQIKPDSYQAHYYLGAALFYKGDINGAIASFRAVIQIKPDYMDVKNKLKKILELQQKNLTHK